MLTTGVAGLGMDCPYANFRLIIRSLSKPQVVLGREIKVDRLLV